MFQAAALGAKFVSKKYVAPDLDLYNGPVHSSSRGPGPRKASSVPLLRKRSVELWCSSDYRVRQMFEAADVMSEGAPREESEGPVYYGMTSIVLPLESNGGQIPDGQLATVAKLLAHDPHARVRAIRIAWREAQVRSAFPLGQLKAELSFSTTHHGVKIDVDVEAPPLPQVARSRSAG